MTETLKNKSELGEIPSGLLESEIFDLRERGYDVSVGSTEDLAYEEPEKISGMFSMLNDLGLDYKQQSGAANIITMATLSLNSYANRRGIPTPGAFGQIRKKRDRHLEGVRAEVLFDETKMPWHLQRGRALALQTIVDAHDLRVDGGPGLHDTMSGRLSLDVEGFVFSEKDGAISDMSLREAFIDSKKRLEGKDESRARKDADKAFANLEIFLNAPVTQDFKDVVAYCQDSLGIRNRLKEVLSAVDGHVSKRVEAEPDLKSMVLLSIGCGTAQAILEVAKGVLEKGIKPTIILLDQDPIALASARKLAEQMGLSEYVEVHCERLFDKSGRPFNIEKILAGRKVDVAEDTGLREYLPDRIYKNLSSTVWRNLSEGGMMTTGNMNVNRPQPEFLHGLMGWYPNVIMRKIKQGFDLHEKSGVPREATKAQVTHDGVYTLFFSYK